MKWNVFMLFGFLTMCDSPVSKNRHSADAEMTWDEVIRLSLPEIRKTYPDGPERPDAYTASYQSGKWTVYPMWQKGLVGGGPSAEVDDREKTVLRVFFSE